jgi:hypothetical protein
MKNLVFPGFLDSADYMITDEIKALRRDMW